MNIEIWVLYVLTVLALMSTPGPSHLLMLSNSASHGFKNSLATAAGDLSANSLQMLAAALGLGVLITSSDIALSIIKWCGVSYLIWRAFMTIKHSSSIIIKDGIHSKSAPIKTLFLQGFITSASNPKAVLFFAALFPQFITYNDNFWFQFFIFSVTYLTIDGLFLSAYGFGALWVISCLKPTSTIWVNRVGGLLMLVAAVLLGIKSIDV